MPSIPRSSPQPDSTGPRAGGPIGPAKPGARGRSNLLALSSLAVLAVYSAGYVRTQAGARRFEAEGRKTRMAPQTVAEPATPTETPAATPPAADPVLVAKLTTPVAPDLPKAISAPEPAAPAPSPVVEEPKPVASVPPVPAASAPASLPSPEPAAAPPPSTPAATVLPSETTAVASPATAPAPAAKLAEPNTPATESSVLPADGKPSKWKDGKYSGWGSCRHGDIEATVEIRGGRIISAVVSKCRTVYSCNVIDKVVPQVVTRQSPDIDSVSGSTQSADSFYWAVYSALQDAEIKPTAAK